MTLTIEILPELEGQIRQAAAHEGLSPDVYILESITARLRQPARIEGRHFVGREAELLQAINQSMAHIDWVHYRELIGKRQAETLTTEEQTMLIALADEVEKANVKRIALLVELARLRHTTLPTLMKTLGIKPVTNE